jgi:hypothetical protein
LTSNTSRQGGEETELLEIIGLDNDTMHNPEYQDRSGFIPKDSMKIPRPVQFQLPKKHLLNMHPIELELMLFLNENNITPVYFNHLMKWLFKAKVMKYFDGRY